MPLPYFSLPDVGRPARLTRVRRLAIAAALAAVLAGCAGPTIAPLPDPPPGPPGPVLAIAPPALGYVPTPERPLRFQGDLTPGSEQLACAACEEALPYTRDALPACPDCGHHAFRTLFSGTFLPMLLAPDLARRAGDLLEARRTFEGVRCLDEPGLPPGRAREEALAEAARAAGARWLLTGVLERAEVALIERTGLYPVQWGVLVVSSVLLFPGFDPINWFLPGEVYGIRARLRVRLLDLETGEVVGQGAAERVVSDSFADFGLGSVGGRGWFLVGFMRVPGCLDEEDWASISAQLEETARQDLVHALVLAAEGRGAPTPAPAALPASPAPPDPAD